MEETLQKPVRAIGQKLNNTQLAAETLVRQAIEVTTEYAFSVLGAIILIFVGFFLAGIVSRGVRRSLQRLRHVDITLASFLSNIVKYAIWILVFVMVLGQFGVQTTSIIAVLGAAGLAIGLALQGTLANIAAGIMLLILRPFRVGEYIDANGITGTVEEIGLFTTELKMVDGLFVMAPNNQLWNSSIVNYSRHPTRRFEIIVGIDYDDSMQEARNILMDMATSDERVLDNPAPQTFVANLGDSSVDVGLRVWTKTSNYLALSWDLTEAAKQRFDENGITIPYPRRELIRRRDKEPD
ncbi:MAG: mechanosensitive ion channel [Ahrensia sp.]|nr:mechanosensitive ion channel [Ahrensia sp.]